MQHGQESLRAPTKLYGINQKTVAKWRSRPRHVGLDPGFVEEDEVFGDRAWLVLSPRRPRGGEVRTVLLSGMEGPFFARPTQGR
jgi:hypothetical protein